MARKTEMKKDENMAVQGEEPETETGSEEEEEQAAPEEPRGEAGQDAPPEEEPPGEKPPGIKADSGPGDGLEGEVEVLQEDLARLRDQHLRLAADFENYRKRVSAELTSGWVRAQADLAGALLDGLDDLQRVSRFTSEDATLEALIEGVDLVERKLLKALTDAGLQAVDPAGEPFDPNTMEAMMRVPTEEEDQDETVHQVFQKGYLFRDQLIRPARVSVYKDDD